MMRKQYSSNIFPSQSQTGHSSLLWVTTCLRWWWKILLLHSLHIMAAGGRPRYNISFSQNFNVLYVKSPPFTYTIFTFVLMHKIGHLKKTPRHGISTQRNFHLPDIIAELFVRSYRAINVPFHGPPHFQSLHPCPQPFIVATEIMQILPVIAIVLRS